MNILVLSDTHRDHTRIAEVFRKCPGISAVIHCGDVDDDCDYIEALAEERRLPFYAVCGNNDFFSLRPYQRIEEIEDIRFFITHGHIERVRKGLEGLLKKAAQYNCQVVCYGHTHQKCHSIEDGVHIINPGALSGTNPSYAVITLENSEVSVKFYQLDE